MKTFTDPVVRCVDCQRIIFRHEIQEFGMCPGCGTKRVKNVLLLTEEEMNELKDKCVSSEFLDEFEVKDE